MLSVWLGLMYECVFCRFQRRQFEKDSPNVEICCLWSDFETIGKTEKRREHWQHFIWSEIGNDANRYTRIAVDSRPLSTQINRLFIDKMVLNGIYFIHVKIPFYRNWEIMESYTAAKVVRQHKRISSLFSNHFFENTKPFFLSLCSEYFEIISIS